MRIPTRLKRIVRKLTGDPDTLLEEMPDCPGLFHSYRELIATGHQRVHGGWRYNGQFYPDYLTVGGAVFGILRKAQQYCTGKGLDIGASSWPLPGSTPIDPAYGPSSLRLCDIKDGSQDFVFSSHTLEHIVDWDNELSEWTAKIKTGGILLLYLPHPDCWLWRKENPFMAKYHEWVPTPIVVKEAVTRRGCEIVDFDDGPDNMYSFHVLAIKR